MADSFLPPLTSQEAIVDKDGKPTIYFQRFMQQLQTGPNIAVNNGVVDVSGVLTYIDGNGDGSVPNPTGWVAGEWRIMPTKDFVVENRNTHVFLEFDPDTYANGVMWGGDAAFAQVWGLGIPSAAGRFQLLGSAAFEFLNTPYVVNDKIFHAGNLIFGTNLTYNPGTGVLNAAGAGGGSTPTIRASLWGGQFNANNINITLPVGTQVGDVVFAWATNGYDTGVVTQAGWTLLFDTGGADYMNGFALAKVMTAPDIALGYVNVTFAGAYYGVRGAVAVVGATMNGIRAQNNARSSGAGSVTNQSVGLAGAQNSDLLLGFCAVRGGANVALSNFTAIGANNAVDASGQLSYRSGSAFGPLGFNEAVTASAANNGMFYSILALSGP